MPNQPSEEPEQKKSFSFWHYWAEVVKIGWEKSQEKFGIVINVAGLVAAAILVFGLWYIKSHANFKDEEDKIIGYWFVVIPAVLWLGWFFYYFIKTPAKIFNEQRELIESLRLKLLPKFKIDCNKSISGCAARSSEGSWVFLRLRVMTDCNDGIDGCIGHLTKIEKDGAIVFDHESRPLPFAPSEDSDSACKTLLHGVPYYLDVIGVRLRESMLWVAAPNGRTVPALDNSGKYVFYKSGEYIFTVSVSGKNVPTIEATLKLIVAWPSVPEMELVSVQTIKSDIGVS